MDGVSQPLGSEWSKWQRGGVVCNAGQGKGYAVLGRGEERRCGMWFFRGVVLDMVDGMVQKCLKGKDAVPG